MTTNFKEIKKELDMKLFFSKWLFVSKLKKLKTLGSYKEIGKGADLVEKQMLERELQLNEAKNPS